MFWRQATNAKILVDAAGKALVYASAGSEVNNCCIAYRSDSDTVAVAEVVMVEGIDNWGATEITVSTADNVRSFTVDGTTYSFTDGAAITPAVTEWVSPLYYRYNESYALVNNEGKLIVVVFDEYTKRIFTNPQGDESDVQEGAFYAAIADQQSIDAWGFGSIEVSGSEDLANNYNFVIDGVACKFSQAEDKISPAPIAYSAT